MGLKKAISPIIAIIIILLITIAIAGAGYAYLSTYWTGLTSKQIQVLSTFCVQTGSQGKILVKNIGTSSFDTSEITIIDAQNGEDISQDVLWSSSVGDPSLVLQLRFDEGSGTKATDTSGKGNDGTLEESPDWVDGKIGGALQFDGMNYVKVNQNIYSDDMTLVLWVKPSVINDGSYHGFAGYEGASTFYRPFNLWVGPSGGNLHWWITRSDNNAYHAGHIENFFTDIDIWYHIAFVKDDVELKIYKNGAPIPLPDSPFTDLYKPNVFRIGRVNNYFNGKIDEIRIYNRAFSEDEIKALAENSVTLEAGETAYMTHTCDGRCRYSIILGASAREASLEC